MASGLQMGGFSRSEKIKNNKTIFNKKKKQNKNRDCLFQNANNKSLSTRSTQPDSVHSLFVGNANRNIIVLLGNTNVGYSKRGSFPKQDYWKSSSSPAEETTTQTTKRLTTAKRPQSSNQSRRDVWIPRPMTPGPQAYFLSQRENWNKGVSAPFRSQVTREKQPINTTTLYLYSSKDYDDANDSSRSYHCSSKHDDVTVKSKSSIPSHVPSSLPSSLPSSYRSQISSTSKVQNFGSTAPRNMCPRIYDKFALFPNRSEEISSKRVGPGSYI
mmetsp:Transcript_59100/g.71147  ORF Transcript_59100/g.71147 Transcript_59100/m.71147 type:complete len:271 (-) Transcript_59100:188-1000(-)